MQQKIRNFNEKVKKYMKILTFGVWTSLQKYAKILYIPLT